MALNRFGNTSSLLAGTRYGANRENPEGLLGKAAIGKRAINSATARTALGNISNRTGLPSGVEGKKGQQAKPRLTKSAATTSLHTVVDKENPIAVKQEKAAQKAERHVKEEVPASPMDISLQGEAFSKQMLPSNVVDIDKDDSDNPQLVSEYVNDIYEYMRSLERELNVRPRYLDGMEINGRMRAILVDWLVQVHLRFHLLQETLYLTIGIIDRFLQVCKEKEQQVSRSKLQLVGVTAMLVASKYEEMYAPEIADFVYITDNAYSKADIRKMECIILKTLDFNLGRPLPLHFLRRNSKAGEVDANKHTLAKYLMELTITDYDMVHYHPSQIAAASLCLSMMTLDQQEQRKWTDTLSYYSKYTEHELQPIMQRMAHLVTKAGTGKLTAIKTKYQSSKFMRIANLPELKSEVILDLAQSATAE